MAAVTEDRLVTTTTTHEDDGWGYEVECPVCGISKPARAFPTDPASGRDFRMCRPCLKVARSMRTRPDYIHPKVQSVIDLAESYGLRVTVNQDYDNIVSLEIRKTKDVHGDTLLHLVNRADNVHLVYARKTGKFLSGQWNRLTTHTKIEGPSRVRSVLYVMGL